MCDLGLSRLSKLEQQIAAEAGHVAAIGVVEQDERELIPTPVSRLAVGKAGKTAKVTPVGRARIGIIA